MCSGSGVVQIVMVVFVAITLAVLVVVVMFWGLSVCEGFARVYFAGCDATNTYA